MPNGSERTDVERRSPVWREESFLAALEAAVTALGEHAAQLDALNVFPVADRDTGTNLLLTAQAAWRGARAAAGSGLRTVARAAADAALRAAHGNSGVILSQFFRALAETVADRDDLDAATLASALDRADRLARQALLQPVEGTMITVLRAAAEAAQQALVEGATLPELLRRVSDAAIEAVARTPEYLPILRERGVVDSGAQGLAVVFDAWAAWAQGTAPDLQPQPVSLPGFPLDTRGSCINVLLEARGISEERIAAELAQLGESVEIIGDTGLLRVHLHAEQPERVLQTLQRYGRPLSVVIDDLAGSLNHLTLSEPRTRTLLVLSPAPRIVTLAHRLGALGVAPTERASLLESLAQEIAALPVEQLTVLPGSWADWELASALAQRLDRPQLVVLPVRSLAAQLVVLLLHADGESRGDSASIAETLPHFRTAEIERADSGEWVAHIPDMESAVSRGEELVTVLLRALDALGAEAAESCTIVVGEAVPLVAPLREAITARWPHLTVEWFWGHQPAPALSLALE